jgi:hypothetical protein
VDNGRVTRRRAANHLRTLASVLSKTKGM